MAATKTKKLNDKISEAADQAKENPYLNKIIEDKELRENAVAALQSVKSAFDQAKEKGFDNPAEIVQDEKIKKQLKKAAGTLKETGDEIASAGKKKRHPLRKLVAIAVIGGIIAIVVSEDARKAVLDTLFGAEEEFEYTSTTSAPASSTNGAS
jgi:CHASE3 domain sensor protein